MFGYLAALVVCGWFSLPLIFGLLRISTPQQRKEPWNWFIAGGAFILWLVFVVLLAPHYYGKIEAYWRLKTLSSAEVVKIEIDRTTWNTFNDIQGIVGRLNQAVWHETNHDGGGPFVKMTITLKSGDELAFRIGRYYGEAGAIIQFYREATGEDIILEYGDTYIPGLAGLLDQMDYPLPPPIGR